MTLRGTIKNGGVVFDTPAPLPDGTAVEVRPVEPVNQPESAEAGPTLYERLADVIGIAEGLPKDMAENHDHYIHGTPKRHAR